MYMPGKKNLALYKAIEIDKAERTQFIQMLAF